VVSNRVLIDVEVDRVGARVVLTTIALLELRPLLIEIPNLPRHVAEAKESLRNMRNEIIVVDEAIGVRHDLVIVRRERLITDARRTEGVDGEVRSDSVEIGSGESGDGTTHRE